MAISEKFVFGILAGVSACILMIQVSVQWCIESEASRLQLRFTSAELQQIHTRMPVTEASDPEEFEVATIRLDRLPPKTAATSSCPAASTPQAAWLNQHREPLAIK